MKVYVGATFSRYEEARAIMDAFTANGDEVTHDWTRTDAFGPDGHPLPDTAGGYDLDPEDGRRHAEADVAAVKRADVLVMLGQEPSCGWPIELGIGIAEEKDIIVVTPFKYTVFWDLPNVELMDSADDVLRAYGIALTGDAEG